MQKVINKKKYTVKKLLLGYHHHLQLYASFEILKKIPGKRSSLEQKYFLIFLSQNEQCIQIIRTDLADLITAFSS